MTHFLMALLKFKMATDKLKLLCSPEFFKKLTDAGVNDKNILDVSEADLKEFIPNFTLPDKIEWRKLITDFVALNVQEGNLILELQNQAPVNVLPQPQQPQGEIPVEIGNHEQGINAGPENVANDQLEEVAAPPAPVTENANVISDANLQIKWEPKINYQEINVEQVLKASVKGRILLVTYKQKSEFSDDEQSKVAGILIDFCLNNGVKITDDVYNSLASKIKEQFPEEDKDDYYDPRDSTIPGHKYAKGKLVSQKKNLTVKLKSLHIIPANKRKADESVAGLAEQPLGVDELWLKHHTAPWSEVESKWANTFESRKSDLYNSQLSIEAYLNKWHQLKNSLGSSLVEIDFQKLYPGKETLLLEKWAQFANKIEFLKSKIKDQTYIDLLDSISCASNEDERDMILLRALPVAIGVNNVMIRHHGKKLYKPSAVECSDALVQRCNIPADVDEIISNRIEKLSTYGLQCQPFIIVVGQDLSLISAIHVVFKGVRYEVDTFLKAIDLCFKTFIATDTEYPREAELSWLFIQRYFYDISTGKDKKGSIVPKFIKAMDEFGN